MIEISKVRKIKISEHLEDVKRKENLSYQRDDLMKQQSMMTALYADEETIAEPSTQCNFEGNESPGVPVIMTEQQQEDDVEIFKKLKTLDARRTVFSFIRKMY